MHATFAPHVHVTSHSVCGTLPLTVLPRSHQPPSAPTLLLPCGWVSLLAACAWCVQTFFTAPSVMGTWLEPNGFVWEVKENVTDALTEEIVEVRGAPCLASGVERARRCRTG